MTAWYAAECAKSGWIYGLSTTDLDGYLDALEIPHETRDDGDLVAVRRATDGGLPVIVGFKPWSALGSHAVVCVDVTDTHVYFVDPNDCRSTYRYSVSEFVRQWDLWYTVVKPAP